ncbi:MAG: hypothetical protein J6A98_00580 [Clostridia bacterium]|nr:hypothetical protein [Clostridia bacterium]
MSKYFDGDKLSGYEDSPITYVYGGNLEEYHKVISDLEAKLAESERQYQEYRQIVEKDIKKEIDERMRDTIKEFNFDISQLKQQLAESEKNVQIEEMLKNYGKEEIKKLHKRIDEIVERDKNIVTELNQQLAKKEKAHMEAMENALNDFLTLRQELNQAKTDFAIEQIEQIKRWFRQYDNYERHTTYEVLYQLDRQIKELRNEK